MRLSRVVPYPGLLLLLTLLSPGAVAAPPSFDVARFLEDRRTPPVMFSGSADDTWVLVPDGKDQVVEAQVTLRYIDPATGKEERHIGPIVSSAVGGGQFQTSTKKAKAFQAEIDSLIATANLRRATMRPSNLSGKRAGHKGKGIVVAAIGTSLRIVRTLDGKPVTRLEPLTAPKEAHDLCGAAPLLRLVGIAVDSVSPWAVVQIGWMCAEPDAVDDVEAVYRHVFIDLRK